MPPTIFAQIVPSTIVVGQSAVLSWATTGAVSLTSNEFGSLPLSGSMVVNPKSSSFYHFAALSGGYSPTETDTVVELEVLSNEASFALQKVILTLKQDRIPVRGRNGGGS